jgi:uncharacterized protein YkwD
VAAHDAIRAKHCAPPLRWSKAVAASAKAWAEHLRQKGCALQHSHGRYGENLAAGTRGSLDAATVVRMWSDEARAYDFARGGFSMKTGHFTQVAWRATRELGCAQVSCGDLDLFVCQYDPPGNLEGAYRENVQPTSCRR